MNRFSDVVRERLGAFLGVGGFLGVGALAATVSTSTPDAGFMAPLVAAAAEETRIEVLNSGETFGGILNRTELTPTEQQALLLAFREHGDPSRLKVGTEVHFRFTRSNGYLRGIDVTLNADQMVRINRDEVGWYSSLIETEVQVDTLVVRGTIERDLYTAFVEDPELVQMPLNDRWEVGLEMAQVFQWQLDFHKQIHRGDGFGIVFEREVRPDGSMRDARILAAEIHSAGKVLNAIWFDLHGDGVGGYYDLEGNSLKRSFLKAPLDFRRISSSFSTGRLHPILNVTRAHNGVDYAAASGTEVRATADGTITVRGVSGGYGNLVEIRHASGYTTRYAHLSRFATGTRVGGRVSQGEPIGYVGMTGLATGPHLHYEMLLNGRYINPATVDLPQGDPIPAEALDRWNVDFQARQALLIGAPAPGMPNETRMAEVPTSASGTRGSSAY